MSGLTTSVCRPLTRAILSGVAGGLTDEFQALLTSLFGNGDQGAMLIPELQLLGRQALYTDSEGTTTVSADGDPTGLALDPSQGLKLGPELVVDGGFDDPAEWTTNGTVISGGVVTIVSDGTYVDAKQGVLVAPPGSWYLIEFDAVVRSGSGIIQMGTPQTGHFTNFSVTGHHRAVIQSGDGNEIFIKRETACDLDVDNISVRELPGNHLTQAVSADRPLYQTDGSKHWLAFDGAGDHLKMPSLATSGGLLVSCACKFDNPSGTDMIVGESIDSATGIKIGVNADGYFVRLVDGVASFQAGSTDLNAHVISVSRNETGDTELYVDGVLLDSENRQGSCVLDVVGSARVDGPGQPFEGSMYGLVVALGANAPDERGRVEAYLAKLAGITL